MAAQETASWRSRKGEEKAVIENREGAAAEEREGTS